MPQISTMFDLIQKTPPAHAADHKWFDYAGIELELENVNFGDLNNPIPSLWTTHSDQSLRNGVEFVTSTPLAGTLISEAIDNFYNKKMDYQNGPRCSTHIHINMSNSTTEVLQSMFLIMYTIEHALYKVVEESRKWGGYAMALNQMSNSRIRSILRPVTDLNLRNGLAPTRNQERYYGFNTNVRRHGTVEFRYFPGGPTKEELTSWVDLVFLVKGAAMNYPLDMLIDAISNQSDLQTFLLREFGEWGQKLLSAVDLDAMYNMFLEAASMAVDTDNREIPSALIYPSSALMKFVSNRVLAARPEAIAYFEGAVSSYPVLAKSEWDYYLSSAKNMGVLPGQRLGENTFIQTSDPFEDNDDDYHDDDDQEDIESYEERVQRERYEEELCRRLISERTVTPPEPVTPSTRYSWNIGEPISTQDLSYSQAVQAAMEAVEAEQQARRVR
jgi:hypothetical protein